MLRDSLTADPRAPVSERVEKLLGSDTEVANFLDGLDQHGSTGPAASRLLLAEVRGVRRKWGYHVQDSHRKFLPANGGCAYIDLDHAEIPSPEVWSAFDFVAAWHGMLRILDQARQAANDRLPPGRYLRVLVNNSDGLGNSYGSHLSLLITRRAFDNLFQRKLHHLLYLASFQASSIILTGQGKVGAENGAPDAAYQISQRADFFETLCGHQTTHHRPLVNCRDEALCGSDLGRGVQVPWLARLHVIFYDSNLCHVANLLKTGVLQIVASMIESECLDPGLILDDPVSAVVQWSHDPDLGTRVRLADGRRLNAVEHQQHIFDAAQRFAARGGCEGIVPEASSILETWGRTLVQLRNRDFDALASCLDWVLKRRTLERALAVRPDLTWRSPEIKRLDHLYSSLDPAEGLYWACERAGFVRRLADDARIERFASEPPEDTRAWTRARLLRLADDQGVEYVDWDRIVFRLIDEDGWPLYRTLWMPDPRAMTRSQSEHLFRGERSLQEIVSELQSQTSRGPLSEVTDSDPKADAPRPNEDLSVAFLHSPPSDLERN